MTGPRDTRIVTRAAGIHLRDVTISQGRWSLYIDGTDDEGNEVHLIASADSFFTNGDGIWFGTQLEHTEAFDV